MATAPKESAAQHQRGRPDRGGAGGGGKIRRTAYRNTQATPYDRPLTALLNSNNSVGNTNGWLSRLVDPASKVIAASARKILSSFISRRILPASAPKAPPSVLQSTNVHQGTSSMVRHMAGKNAEDVVCGHSTHDIDEVAELEQMLKQKRFTRYEIDRLTTLLRSRTVNGSNGGGGNPSMKNASEQVLKHHAHSPKLTPVTPFYRYNGSTPTPTRHKVFDDDITSPLDLAKAYMSSRASKCSPPKSESQGLSLSSWTPNMLHSASLKGSNLRKCVNGEQSSSVKELSVSQSRVSDFKNASLKRRSSVLQDQYGSIGPIRRVRQKLNLLNSKDRDALLHESSPSISKSTDKRIALADTPTSSVDPAPTNSNEVVQQTVPSLDQPTYPQNKAVSDEIVGRSAARIPLTSTSASETLARQKFINLEKGESSGIIKDDQLDNMIGDSRDTSICVAGYSSMKDGMSSENEQTKINNSASEKNSDIELLKNTPLQKNTVEATFCDRKKSDAGQLQNKQTFCMSVLEDFIDMDEDDAEVIPSHSISHNEETHPLMSLGLPLPVTPTGANDKPSGISRMGSVIGLESSDEPRISEKRGSHVAVSNGVFKLSTDASLKGQDDGLHTFSSILESPGRTPSPIFATDSAALKLHSPSDSKLEAYRFTSGSADVDRTPERIEGDRVNAFPEAAAPILETSSIFSFGDATNNKGNAFNGSSGSSLHSTAIHSNFDGDKKQYIFPATNSTIVGNNNGFGSLSTGASTILSRHAHTSYASDNGGGLANVKESTGVSETAPSTPSSAPTTGSSAASTSSIFGSMASPVAVSDGALSSAPVATSFAASSTSASFMSATNFLFGASSASGTGFTFGATTTPGQTSAATNNTGFVTSASTSGTTTSASANTGFVFGGSSTPASVTSSSGVSFGTPSAAVNTSPAGFSFGASSTSATTSNRLPSVALSTPAITSSLFSIGASSTSATTSSGLQSSVSSTPANTSSLFSFGTSSAPATNVGLSFGASSAPATSGGLSFGALSTPATTSTGDLFGGALTTGTVSSVFPSRSSSTLATITSSVFGASSTPAATNSVLPFGSSSTPATISSAFSFGASSTPAAISSMFSSGDLSTPATANSGFSFGISSIPAATSSGFSFGGSSTPAVTSSGFSFGGSSTPTDSSSGFPAAASSALTGSSSSAFLFNASSTSTPVTSTAGFLSGISSTFGASPTPNPFSFGAASTPAASTANNGFPFGFTAGSSTFPLNSGTGNNTTSAQALFGNINPFSSTAGVNNNNQTSMEDSMAEDSMQASPPAFPAFGAQQTANTSIFGFTAPNPTGASNSFQFPSQPNLSNPSPFQSSASLGGFNAGGSFSLGSTGDKSARRIIKPKKGVRRK